jgi:trans-aconitate methyltransferase
MNTKKDTLIRKFSKRFFPKKFPGTVNYWENRYVQGGNSGAGSYNKLAEFKAEVLNEFVNENKISSVIEYGCGDGNQLVLANYPTYTGFDVSAKAIKMCENLFKNDTTKNFKLTDEYNSETAELTLSLEVIFHIIEDELFDSYMQRLFDSSTKYVIIFSSNTNDNSGNSVKHVKHRKFTDWVDNYRSNWKLEKYLPNKYPVTPGVSSSETSFSDFYIYKIQESK